MAKFYVYDNATRRLRGNGFTYTFEVIEQFGGNWRGVLKLENEAEITALAGFGPAIGVNEITEEEYNNYLKKKTTSLRSFQDTPRQPTLLQQGAGHVVIKEPSAPTTPKKAGVTVVASPKVEEAIIIGKAPYVDPLEGTKMIRRKQLA